MTRAQVKASRCRWILLIAALLCWLIAAISLIAAPWIDWAGTIGTPAIFFPELDDEAIHYVLQALIYIGLFLLSQWFFLRPHGRFQFHLEAFAKPLISRKITAAFIAMVLSIAWIAVLLELPDWWEKVYECEYGIVWIWIAMGIIWLIWCIIFFLYWKQTDHFNPMGKIIRALLVGSVLNVFVSAWVFIKNPHQEECYCVRGSYTSLVFGTTVLLWTFGPGLVLLFLREKNRREKFTLPDDQMTD